MREPKLDIVQRMLDWADTICTLNSHVPPSSKTKMVREAAAEIRQLRAELAAMQKQRDEARRAWCYMESCRRCEYAIEPSDERSIAAERGWDCFKEGGGA